MAPRGNRRTRRSGGSTATAERNEIENGESTNGENGENGGTVDGEPAGETGVTGETKGEEKAEHGVVPKPEEEQAPSTKQIKDLLLEGFEVKSRADDSVHTIKAGKVTVGEVCVGKTKVRLNFKTEALVTGKGAPKTLKLSGHAGAWKGGGATVNVGNLSAARQLLEFAVAKAMKSQPETPTAEDVAKEQAAREAEASEASKRLQESGTRETAKA